VDVKNPTWGPLFGYEGRCDVTWLRGTDAVAPPHVRPLRDERRE
jgi:hypothetical protein